MATAAREKILDGMMGPEHVAMYDVLQAIASAATGDGVRRYLSNALLSLGDDTPTATAERCANCHLVAAAGAKWRKWLVTRSLG